MRVDDKQRARDKVEAFLRSRAGEKVDRFEVREGAGLGTDATELALAALERDGVVESERKAGVPRHRVYWLKQEAGR